jgi:beta-phosphoglucomutase-like phosphatase (HAD superfamily)
VITIAAVIFDCDGTLVDSEPLARAAWAEALAAFGYAPTAADHEANVGLPYARTHAYFAERVALPSSDAFWPLYSGALYALMDDGLVVFDDAVDAARDLRGRGIPVAVASTSRRERLDRTLARAGLAEAFDATVAGDEVARGKPAPDMFLAAAARLGVAPANCVAIEDSPPGVAAAQAAGMVTIAVVRVSGTEAALAAADRVLDRLGAEAILAAAPTRT